MTLYVISRHNSSSPAHPPKCKVTHHLTQKDPQDISCRSSTIFQKSLLKSAFFLISPSGIISGLGSLVTLNRREGIIRLGIKIPKELFRLR